VTGARSSHTLFVHPLKYTDEPLHGVGCLCVCLPFALAILHPEHVGTVFGITAHFKVDGVRRCAEAKVGRRHRCKDIDEGRVITAFRSVLHCLCHLCLCKPIAIIGRQAL
jgi:hypothetical protein